MEKLAYSPEEACPILGLGRTTLYELMRRREIESIKVGRRRIIPADALRDFVHRMRSEQAGDAA